ncbi:MAG: hypothetical protein R2813_13805 [Flavobacteriales bacterium]
MNHAAKGIAVSAIAISLFSCSHQNTNDVASDEVHRPADWSSDISMKVSQEVSDGDVSVARLISSSSSASYESLLEQLWEMAFSGDQNVYVPNIIGEPDYEHPVDPKGLLEHLKQIDTIYVEDMITGELSDTTIDMSFTQESVSSMVVYFDLSESGEMMPNLLALGKQVFDEQTGAYRGNKNELYLAFNGDQKENSYRLMIESDSTGIFRPTRFETWLGQDKLVQLLSMFPSEGKSVNIHVKMECTFSGQHLSMASIKPTEA